MNNVYIEKASLRGLLSIYKYYLHDFPRSERKPFLLLLYYIITGKGDLFILKSDDNMVAYALVLTDSKYNVVLLDYLSTIEKYRSSGYGSRFILELEKFYSDKRGIIVEIEEVGMAESVEENILRERRKQFYLQNGFMIQPVKLIFFGVEMNMLYLKINSELKDFIDAANDIYARSLGKNIYKKLVQICYKK